MTHPPMDVLLVEDNPTDLLLLREALAEDAALRVRCAERLGEALRRLHEARFDVILLDLSLPDAQGLEGVRRIHSLYPSMPLVVLTGTDDARMALEAVRQGAQDYLVKGRFDGGLLLRALRYALERKKAEESLREADRRKNAFLAMLGHELRNPLAAIRSAVELQKRTRGDPRQAARATDVIDRQVRQLTRLVDDLLEVSRITRGKIQLRKEVTDLEKVVSAAVETSQPLLDSRRHELTVHLPARPVLLEADPARLAQALANLLDNAAKYTEEGGHVWLTAEQAGDTVEIEVRDDGIGIPEAMLPHVFEAFSQVEGAREHARGGLGLGLTLVRCLIALHGGEVTAYSGGEGQGSSFRIRLPVLSQAAVADLPVGEHGGLHEGPALRILVVDDEEDAAEMLAALLRLDGHEVTTAPDGRSALELAPRLDPDVVLLDIGMPGLNGYEVARGLRRQQGDRKLLLIALTGYGKDEDQRRAKEAGFDCHLTKPVNGKTLQKLLAGAPCPQPSY